MCYTCTVLYDSAAEGKGGAGQTPNLLLGLGEGLNERGRVLFLLGADEGVSRALAAGSAGPPDAVDVILEVVGARVVDDAHQVGYVQPPEDETRRWHGTTSNKTKEVIRFLLIGVGWGMAILSSMLWLVLVDDVC